MECLWSIVTSTNLATLTSKYSKESLSGISGDHFKHISLHLLCRYLIDKLGEEKEEKKKGYRNFLKRNAASLRKNAMCSPTISNTSNSCHIVYMDGSPSYPASGADTLTKKYEEGCKTG